MVPLKPNLSKTWQMTDELKSYRDLVEQQLETLFIDNKIPARLNEAMRYSVLNGGKRIRSSLVYLTTEALGGNIEQAHKSACAIECIHAYSLIHDDLPAMDDDALRRGKPTLHIQFDEAMAILAGDALQTLAFELIANDTSISPQVRIALIQLLTHAAGAQGMVAGQVLDLAAEDNQISEADLEHMHRRKTGDLISASVMAAAEIANASDTLKNCLRDYGYSLGLAFQVKDDILDVVGSTEKMGKQQGADSARNKTTFTSTHGLNAAQARLDDLYQTANQALAPLGDKATKLLNLATFVVNRQH